MIESSGWNRFNEWAINFDSIRKSGDVTLSTAATIMKEMAEALDKIIYSCNDSSAPTPFGFDECESVYKKFKEWK